MNTSQNWKKLMEKKVDAIVQARTTSSRFPEKILQPLLNGTVLSFQLERLKVSKKINNIIYAITDNKLDDKLERYLQSIGVDYFRGCENNVLKRYADCAKAFNSQHILRVTSDDPFKDPYVIDKCIDRYFESGVNFLHNNNPPSFPEGIDVEVFDIWSLNEANKIANSEFDKEHVTQIMFKKRQKFRQINIKNAEDYSNIRLTIDQEEDYVLCKEIISNFGYDSITIPWEKIVDYLLCNKHIISLNKNVKRSFNYRKGNGF